VTATLHLTRANDLLAPAWQQRRAKSWKLKARSGDSIPSWFVGCHRWAAHRGHNQGRPGTDRQYRPGHRAGPQGARNRQKAEQLAIGPEWRGGDDDYVFTSAWGEAIHPDTASSLMPALIKKNNDRQAEAKAAKPLPPAHLHDLHHVHATVLRAGVPVHVVAARLGHADPSITLRASRT